MDESKAAEYYDEMRQKGGGAAKHKQGLGYGASSSPPSSQATFPSFVRGDSHEASLAKFEKESRLATVRDKLKRCPTKHDSSEDDARRNRKHSSPSPTRNRESKYVARGSSRSQSRDREHLLRSGRSHRRERRSGNSSSREADCRHRRRTSNSRSPSGSPSQERRSYRSERKRQELSPRGGRRSRSPRHSSRRSRSVSPTDHHRHSRQRGSRSHRSPSSLGDSRKSESRKEDVRKPNAVDYAKLIPGFNEMTPAEKVRQKMKVQLSDTVSKDTAKGIDADWERFVFNKNAPLDDDAKLDYFGDGTGARDDTGFLQNTGSTFLSTNTSQAKREAQLQAAHDAAIFGPSTGMSSEKMACISEFNGSPLKEASVDNNTAIQPEGVSPINNLLSDQVKWLLKEIGLPCYL
ncbi:hypothetical protein GOP47_0009226 [Adiantum capillus-veneris]|uniref:Uncharacterized protein n=1 Tax=Adiantum capillus-veneris TaxID=13818 RepID=A0A9D4UVU0_ADICA|nr:hypothetical protein GOP47_0009226 [Adiantum capillus-veneris]